MVSGTTTNPTNAKTRTNARKLKTITAQKMPLAEIPTVVSSAHVMLDTRVMVSLALKPTVNINFFRCSAGLKCYDAYFNVPKD